MGEIQKTLDLPNVQILYNWAAKYDWEAQSVTEDPAIATTRRYLLLLNKDKKTNGEIREMESCSTALLNFAKIDVLKNGGSIHGNSKTGTKKSKKKAAKKREKNNIDHLTQADFDRVADKILYPHQHLWREAGKNERTRYDRLILKPRQVGATFFFGFEGFESACTTGENQIFLSATRDQAEMFKAYMIIIADEYFDTDLSGNPFKLSNNAMCFFLSGNSTGAQSRPGNVYFDEMFWVKDWEKMLDLGGAMATQNYKITGFSTPSALSHPACKYWDGRRYNSELPEHKKVKINLNRTALKKGILGGDGVWRNRLTIHDVIKMGEHLPKERQIKIDLERIKRRNPPSVFRNLYETEFVDDSASVFKLAEILKCAVDPKKWETFYNPNLNEPFGNKAVSVGYDPAGDGVDGDDASIGVLSLPEGKHDKFRLFEDETTSGISAYGQAQIIKDWNDRYNIQYLEINSDGPGYFVHEFVEPFYADVQRVKYTPEIKQQMIYKAKDIFRTNRFEYDENDTVIPIAFMTIRQGLTPKTRQITFFSSHSDEAGHGDKAWMIMHGFMAEPLIYDDNDLGQTSSVSFSTH